MADARKKTCWLVISKLITSTFDHAYIPPGHTLKTMLKKMSESIDWSEPFTTQRADANHNLEFFETLGDAVVGNATMQFAAKYYDFVHNQRNTSAFLTNIKTCLTDKNMLAAFGVLLEFDKILQTDDGEIYRGELEDCVEAVFGALSYAGEAIFPGFGLTLGVVIFTTIIKRQIRLPTKTDYLVFMNPKPLFHTIMHEELRELYTTSNAVQTTDANHIHWFTKTMQLSDGSTITSDKCRSTEDAEFSLFLKAVIVNASKSVKAATFVKYHDLSAISTNVVNVPHFIAGYFISEESKAVILDRFPSQFARLETSDRSYAAVSARHEQKLGRK